MVVFINYGTSDRKSSREVESEREAECVISGSGDMVRDQEWSSRESTLGGWQPTDNGKGRLDYLWRT